MFKKIQKIFITLFIFSFLLSLTNTSSAQSTTCLSLTRGIGYGSTGSDVSKAQAFLQAKGFLQYSPTGYFGPATRLAVTNYQKSKEINPVGYIGPQTRNAISQDSCGTSPISSNTPDSSKPWYCTKNSTLYPNEAYYRYYCLNITTTPTQTATTSTSTNTNNNPIYNSDGSLNPNNLVTLSLSGATNLGYYERPVTDLGYIFVGWQEYNPVTNILKNVSTTNFNDPKLIYFEKDGKKYYAQYLYSCYNRYSQDFLKGLGTGASTWGNTTGIYQFPIHDNTSCKGGDINPANEGYAFNGWYTDFYYTGNPVSTNLTFQREYYQSQAQTFVIGNKEVMVHSSNLNLQNINPNSTSDTDYLLYAKWTKTCSGGSVVVYPQKCPIPGYNDYTVIGSGGYPGGFSYYMPHALPTTNQGNLGDGSFISSGPLLHKYMFTGYYSDKNFTQSTSILSGAHAVSYIKWEATCSDGTKVSYPKSCTNYNSFDQTIEMIDRNISKTLKIGQTYRLLLTDDEAINNSNPSWSLYFVDMNGSLAGDTSGIGAVVYLKQYGYFENYKQFVLRASPGQYRIKQFGNGQIGTGILTVTQ